MIYYFPFSPLLPPSPLFLSSILHVSDIIRKDEEIELYYTRTL